jgi:xylose isomerase
MIRGMGGDCHRSYVKGAATSSGVDGYIILSGQLYQLVGTVTTSSGESYISWWGQLLHHVGKLHQLVWTATVIR